MNITNSWDTGMQGELVITNTSDAPIEAWTLSFDTNFVINNLWDGRILDSTDNHYTIASEMWTNPIPVGGSTTIGFTGTKTAETEADVNNFTLTCVDINYSFISENSDNIILFSKTKEILGNTGSQTVYFYVTSNTVVSSISLVDSDANQKVATLVDNGNYSTSGDDMMGDGVYSGKYVINTNITNDVTYAFHTEIDGQSVSNEIKINVIVPFTQQELSDMEYVDNIIKEVLTEYATPKEYNVVSQEYLQNGDSENESFDYIALFEQRYAAIDEALANLSIDGKVNIF